MKIKTSQLSGPALDWAVAKVVGEHVMQDAGGVLRHGFLMTPWRPSNDWSSGGVLFQECCTSLDQSESGFWWAYSGNSIGAGLTPLEAICRAIVASELGDEVDVPDELGGVE